MVKMARFLIKVPVDEALLIEQLREHVRKFLDERGTETVTLFSGADTSPATETPEGQLVDAPKVARIHWTAVEIVKAMEPAAPPPPDPKGRSRRGANGAATPPPG